MAQTATVITYIIFIVLSNSLIRSKSLNFTLKLTHRDSPLSPLYQSNLTDLQRLTKLMESTAARASYLQNVRLRIPSIYREPVFTVDVSIGTPPVEKTLFFDTGSSLTWTQCIPCAKCYNQDEPLFDPKKSSSYKAMPKKHPLAKCFSCSIFGRTCSYKTKYVSGEVATGVAAVEAFTFQSTTGSPVRIPDLVFGCGSRFAGSFPSVVSGVLGFNKELDSFSRQLGGFVNGRFSYCLSPLEAERPSYVTFGDEAVARGNYVQMTPFLRTDLHSQAMYVLTLNEISIDGTKLGLGRSVFAKGCTIDSGATLSMLNKKAFSTVTGFLDKVFSKFRDIKRYRGNIGPKRMHCYTLPEGFKSFPSLVFHFQGADYYVPHSNLFTFIRLNGGQVVFCLAMYETMLKDEMILGSYQQRNMRVVYDLKQGMLSFGPEFC